MAGLGVLALVLLALAAGNRPRAAASYPLLGRSISWLTPSDDFLLLCQRDGRLTKLTSAMSEAGSGWARPFTHPAGFCGRVALAGELVLVSCADGRLRAVDIRTGEQTWEKLAAGAVAEATPTDGVAFFGADNGHLYAVDLTSGRALWEVELGAPIASAPLVTNEQVVVGTVAGVVHCVKRGNGEKRWRFPEKEHIGPIYASPRDGADCILVGSDDGKLYSLSPEGELRGTHELEGLIRAPVAVDGPTAIVGDSGGLLCTINPGDLTEIWRRNLPGPIAVEPILGADRLWCTAGKYLVCLRRDSGRIIWRRKGSGETTDCVRAGRTLYWVTADGLVCAIDIAP